MRAVLALNAGSSSLKFALFSTGIEPLFRGRVEDIGAQARLVLQGRALPVEAPDHEAALALVLKALEEESGGLALVGAGHRVVHGGESFAEAVLVDGEVREALEALIPLAPLHQPHSLKGIDALARLRPGLPQVACFDTAFHRTIPRKARLFALPRALIEEGVRRYGFHGLSYAYIAGVLAGHLGEARRVVVAHLGHGASLCAMKEGQSIATTMTFTPLDGLPMSTRCGSLDPAAVLYLWRKGMALEEVADVLHHRSGLLGLSGISDDMRVLLESEAPEAREAVEVFVYQTACALGAMAAALQGLDALVFTAGIGEGSPAIRARICQEAAWLGIDLDEEANARGEGRISTPESPVQVWVIPTDEERVIARETLQLMEESRHA